MNVKWINELFDLEIPDDPFTFMYWIGLDCTRVGVLYELQSLYNYHLWYMYLTKKFKNKFLVRH